MGLYKIILCGLLSVWLAQLTAQIDKGLVARYTFNEKSVRDDINGLSVSMAGASFVADRFGNNNSACYLHGSIGSYVNLGTSDILKQKAGSISLWFNIDYVIEAGNGYEINPLILTKRSNDDDFYEAYCMYFMYKTNRIGVAVTQSSLNQVGLHSNSRVSLGEWHHVVITFDYNYLTLYLDGKEESKIIKKFDNSYLEGDSILLGNSANTKNKRYLNGAIDDVMFFSRVLNKNEVSELYNEPDPNRFSGAFKWIAILFGLISLSGVIIFLINMRYNTALKKEIEKNELRSRVYEMEIKVLKANMNPHFIFNALNSVQKYVLANDKDNAYKYLSKFSKLLRKLLESNVAESIGLEEELDLIHHYLEMESIRFGNAFSYEVSVSQNVIPSKIRIPHMLVQPFIENAIWHGLLHKNGVKRLDIRFDYYGGQVIECVIDDNGVGRRYNPTKIPDPQKRSLAINLNRERLELLQKIKKIKCGFDIIDKTDVNGEALGTVVHLFIPILNTN